MILLLCYLLGPKLYPLISKILNDLNRRKYHVFIYYLFIYILFNNILGIIPYNESITSKINFTIKITSMIIIGITLQNIYNEKLKYINRFIPNNVPIIIKPFISIIEFISYWIRILSLSIRLSANLTAGHLILTVISNMSYNYIILIPMIILEIGVSLIQSYVFILLIIMYINE